MPNKPDELGPRGEEELGREVEPYSPQDPLGLNEIIKNMEELTLTFNPTFEQLEALLSLDEAYRSVWLDTDFSLTVFSTSLDESLQRAVKKFASMSVESNWATIKKELEVFGFSVDKAICINGMDSEGLKNTLASVMTSAISFTFIPEEFLTEGRGKNASITLGHELTFTCEDFEKIRDLLSKDIDERTRLLNFPENSALIPKLSVLQYTSFTPLQLVHFVLNIFTGPDRSFGREISDNDLDLFRRLVFKAGDLEGSEGTYLPGTAKVASAAANASYSDELVPFDKIMRGEIPGVMTDRTLNKLRSESPDGQSELEFLPVDELRATPDGTSENQKSDDEFEPLDPPINNEAPLPDEDDEVTLHAKEFLEGESVIDTEEGSLNDNDYLDGESVIDAYEIVPDEEVTPDNQFTLQDEDIEIVDAPADPSPPPPPPFAIEPEASQDEDSEDFNFEELQFAGREKVPFVDPDEGTVHVKAWQEVSKNANSAVDLSGVYAWLDEKGLTPSQFGEVVSVGCLSKAQIRTILLDFLRTFPQSEDKSINYRYDRRKNLLIFWKDERDNWNIHKTERYVQTVEERISKERPFRRAVAIRSLLDEASDMLAKYSNLEHSPERHELIDKFVAELLSFNEDICRMRIDYNAGKHPRWESVKNSAYSPLSRIGDRWRDSATSFKILSSGTLAAGGAVAMEGAAFTSGSGALATMSPTVVGLGLMGLGVITLSKVIRDWGYGVKKGRSLEKLTAWSVRTGDLDLLHKNKMALHNDISAKLKKKVETMILKSKKRNLHTLDIERLLLVAFEEEAERSMSKAEKQRDRSFLKKLKERLGAVIAVAVVGGGVNDAIGGTMGQLKVDHSKVKNNVADVSRTAGTSAVETGQKIRDFVKALFVNRSDEDLNESENQS